MPNWINLAHSPLFRFTLALLVLGLLRLAFLSIWEMASAAHQAGDRRIPYVRILTETLGWSFPLVRIRHTRWVYSYASFFFHVGILTTGLFLGNHIDVLQANFGLAWTEIGKPLLDVLSLATILAGSYLLLHRIYVISSRKLSKPMDYILILLILDIFISGYIAGKSWNPIPYNGLMLFHALNGILLLILIPITKIAHCILYPFIRLGTEIAWHFPPEGGSEVAKALHDPERRRI